MRYVHLLAFILVVLLAPQGVSAQQAQRFTPSDVLGGQVSAVTPLPDGTVLATSGSRLIRMRQQGATFDIVAETTLQTNLILDAARAGDTVYVLTAAGITALQASSLQPLETTQGGGQMMALSQRHLAVAAREGGFRLFELGEGGSLARLRPIPVPGDVNYVAFSPQGERLYLATSEGVRVVTLPEQQPPRLEDVPFSLVPAQALTTAGSLVAVAGEGGRVRVYDAERAAQIGEYAPLQAAQQVEVRGEYAFIADAVDGLKIMLLASADRPIQVFSEIGMPAAALGLDGDIAVVAGRDMLRVLDVSSRYQPLVLGQAELPGQAASLSLGEGRAFVTLEEGGIAVVDVRNRSAPFLEQVLPSESAARAALYYNNHLYTAHTDGSLAVYTLQAAQPAAVLPLGCSPSDIDRRGRVLHIACGENGLLAVDVTRPTQPTLVGSIAPNSGDVFTAIDITGKRAYLAGGDHVTVVDISQPERMGRLARVETAARGVAHSDVYFYAVSGSDLSVYDVRATAEPTLLNRYSSITDVAAMTAAGQQIFLTNAARGADLVGLSLSTPASPFEIAHQGSRGMTRTLTASADTLWLARGFAGLQQFSLTEGAPILTATYATPPDAERLATDGQTIAAGGLEGWATAEWLSQGGLRAAQGSDSLGGIRDLAIRGDTLAVAYGERGVGLFGGAERVALRPSVGAAAGVALSEDYLYVADAGGLAIYDSTYLTPITRVDLDLPALGIMLHDDTAYIALADGAIALVDVSQPTGGLRSLAQVETRRPAALLAGPQPGSVFTLSENGILRLDVSDPDNIEVAEQGALPEVTSRGFFLEELLAAYRPGGDVFVYDIGRLSDGVRQVGAFGAGGVDVAVRENAAYIAFGGGGLGLVDIQQSDDPAVLLGEGVTDLLLSGERLYALGDSLTVWDVSTATSPRQLMQITDLRAGQHMALGEDGTLALALQDGVALVDMEVGLVRGRVPTPSPVTHIALNARYGFAALETGGVLVFERGKQQALFTLSSDRGRFAHDLLPLSDDRLLVSWLGGLELFALEDLTSGPTLAQTLPASKVGLTPQGGHFTQSGSRAALSTGVSSTVLIDVQANSVLSAVPTPGEAFSAALDGEILFVADGSCGLRAIDVSQPATPQEVGYWGGSFISDVVSFGDGQLVAVDAGQLVSLRFNPDGEATLPAVPQQPSPADQTRGLPGQVTLQWGPAGNPCNPLAYRIYLGVEDDPPLIGRVTGTPMLVVSDLRPSRTYNWRVEATDRQGDTITSPLWAFTIADADFQSGPPSPPTFIERVQQSPAVPVILVAVLVLGSVFAIRYVQRRHNIR